MFKKTIFLVLSALCLSVQAAIVTPPTLLVWNREQNVDIVGYFVYSGTNKINVGNTNAMSLNSYNLGSTNNFAVSAYAPNGYESFKSTNFTYVKPGYLYLMSPIQITFPLNPGQSVTVQATTDLNNNSWQPLLTTNGPSNQWVIFNDVFPVGSNVGKFYRLKFN